LAFTLRVATVCAYNAVRLFPVRCCWLVPHRGLRILRSATVAVLRTACTAAATFVLPLRLPFRGSFTFRPTNRAAKVERAYARRTTRYATPRACSAWHWFTRFAFTFGSPRVCGTFVLVKSCHGTCWFSTRHRFCLLRHFADLFVFCRCSRIAHTCTVLFIYVQFVWSARVLSSSPLLLRCHYCSTFISVLALRFRVLFCRAFAVSAQFTTFRFGL